MGWTAGSARKFLHAGPGFGGSCLPKDAQALVKTAQDHDVSLRIVEAVIAVNDRRKRSLARKVSTVFGGVLRGKTVAVLGLTFKPNTDDMREAPSIPLITALQDVGATVRAYDPAGMAQAKTVLSNVAFFETPYACAEDADALVIATEWGQSRALDLERLKQIMACPVVIDLRNIYRPEEMARHGFITIVSEGCRLVGRYRRFLVIVMSRTPTFARTLRSPSYSCARLSDIAEHPVAKYTAAVRGTRVATAALVHRTPFGVVLRVILPGSCRRRGRRGPCPLNWGPGLWRLRGVKKKGFRKITGFL